MNSFSKSVLEAVLLFILVFNILQAYRITNQVVLTLVALVVFIFILLSQNFLPRLGKLATTVRFWCLTLVILVVHLVLLWGSILDRLTTANYRIHDGALITEESWRAIVSGKNPYSISYDKVLVSQEDYLDKVKHRETDRNIYSPMAFFINFPTFFLTDKLFNFIDMRITAVVCLLVAAFLALIVIKEKVLFLILFLLNPVFVKSVYFGANDVFILFFLVICLIFLKLKKTKLATVAIALASATKLLILPFVPLYFIYIWWTRPRGINNYLVRHMVLFGAVNLILYLPFVLSGPGDFFDDFFVYNFLGGNLGRPIAGFIGVPQILSKFGIISQYSSVPFFIVGGLASVIFLGFSNQLMRKSPSVTRLIILYLALFVVVFSFSRVVQSDYYAYFSQVLILAAFLSKERHR